MTHFNDLGLAGVLLRAIESEGYTNPTPIQQQAIPYLLEGRDLLGIAQTGTGKTAAFALPILNRLIADRQKPVSRRTRVLVLAPTRELVSQIAESFRSYGRHAQLQIATVFGGVTYGPQVKALGRGLDVLVATPGRLLDHLQRGTLRLDGTEVVVLDEADHMLDLGFIVPIRDIVAKLPARRQTLFFSATMPKEISKLAGEMLDNPAQVTIKPEGTTAERVEQCVYMVEAGAKNALLLDLLKQGSFQRTLIFTRTKRGADRVANLLSKQDVSAQAIHGNKSQSQREKALAGFKRGAIPVLVATDIAARGIDVDSVSHVINYELPDVPESYVHRIGRTARAGADGKAIAFCSGDERGSLRDIQRLTRMTIPAFVWSEDKGTSPIELSSDDLRVQGSGKRRPSRGKSANQRSANPRAANPRSANSRPANGRPANGRPANGRPESPSAHARNARPAGDPGAFGESRAFGEPRRAAGPGKNGEPAKFNRTGKKPHRKGKRPDHNSGNAFASDVRKPQEFVATGIDKVDKPNRPGQRRRRKMQAEKLAANSTMAAAV